MKRAVEFIVMMLLLVSAAEAADKKPAGNVALVPAVSTPWPGKIFVSHDEWLWSDYGLAVAPDAKRLALNVTAWFTGGRPGRFLVYSTNFGLTESGLAAAMTEAGHTWTVMTGGELTLATLQQYDGVFLGGDPVDNALLIDYVRGGGRVFLEGGSGVGGASVEAVQWNTFLSAFGLAFAATYNTTRAEGVHSIVSSSPLLAGVSSLYERYGSSISKLDPTDTAVQIVVSENGHGLFATYESTVLPVALEVCPGRVELDSRDLVWVTIVGSAGLDVRNIDISSLRLAGVATRFSVIAHGAAASSGPKIGKTGMSACRPGDRTADLILRYDSRVLLRAVALTLGEDLHDGDMVALTLTGRLKPQFGGTPIVGESLVKLEDRHKRRGWGWGWRRW